MQKFLISNISKVFLCLLIAANFGCAQGRIDPFDTNSGLSRDEIQDSIIKKRNGKNKKVKKQTNKVAIPQASNLILTPPPPVIGGDKIISFSTTSEVPLKDILIELGRLANIDIDLDTRISGGIIINAKNRPLKEVIDRIATLGNLRYSYKNNVLFFEPDTPYLRNYFVDYLVGGSLWKDVESNITSLLNANQPQQIDPTATNNSIKASFTSNKSAGIISLFANDKQHKIVSNYLKDVQKQASTQVLIEAKVVEVTLSKEFESGINWNWSGINGDAITNRFGVGDTTTSFISFDLSGDIGATVKALERFGTAKAISSPRITTMNNQNATLDFSESLIYFTVSTSASTVAGNANPTTIATVTATKNEIPIGVQLSITPSINSNSNEVTLDIQPTLSVNSGRTADDPSINPDTGDSLENKIPIVRTRTLKTLAKVQSGNILVIGGLMNDSTSDVEIGVPFLSRIPILGHLFKYSSKVTEVVETVIFIKATIVDSSGYATKEDRKLQETFDVNTRKFF